MPIDINIDGNTAFILSFFGLLVFWGVIAWLLFRKGKQK